MKIRLSPGMYQTIVFGIGLVIMKGISFFMLPFITHHITPGDYGNLQLLTIIDELGGLVMAMGLGSAMLRFAGTADSKQEFNTISANILGMSIIISLSLGVAMHLFADQIRDLIPGDVTTTQIRWVITSLIIGRVLAVHFLWLRLRNKAVQFVIFSALKGGIQAAFVVFFIIYGFGVTGIVAANAIAYFSVFLILFVMQVMKTGVKCNWREGKPLLIYGGPLIFNGLMLMINDSVSYLWLAKSLGVEQMALYALASKIALILAVVLEPFTTWWLVRRFSLLKTEDAPIVIARIISSAATLLCVASLLVGIGGCIAIRMLTPEAYHGAIAYVPWLVIVWVVNFSSFLFNLGCYTKKTTYTPTIINVFAAALTLLLFYLTIPLYGVFGAIISLLTVHSFRLVVFVHFSQKILYFPYPMIRLLGLFVLTIVGLFVVSSYVNDIWQIILASTFAGAVLLLSFRMNLIIDFRKLVSDR